MPLPSSGQISMGDINVELGRSRTTANTSLAGGSTPTAGSLFGLATSAVNKTAPHAISEFYGYSNITYTPFDYLYGGDPCSALYWLVYSGSDGKYYVNNGNYVLISLISGTWYQYSFYDDFMMAYVYNMYTSSNGNLTYNGIFYSYCGPF